MSQSKSIRDMGSEPRVTANFLDKLKQQSKTENSKVVAKPILPVEDPMTVMPDVKIVDETNHELAATMRENAGTAFVSENIPQASEVLPHQPRTDCSPKGRRLFFECYDAKLSEVPTEVAFSAYYQGANLMASAVDFNTKLKNFAKEIHQAKMQKRAGLSNSSSSSFSLERILELGIMVGNLGELTLLPIPEAMQNHQDRGRLILANHLIMGGLGPPGSLSRDDVRFLLTNVMFVMNSLQKKELSMNLIGVYSRTLNFRQSLRGIVEGIVEGMERFDMEELTLKIVYESTDFQPGAAKQIFDTFKFLESYYKKENTKEHGESDDITIKWKNNLLFSKYSESDRRAEAELKLEKIINQAKSTDLNLDDQAKLNGHKTEFSDDSINSTFDDSSDASFVRLTVTYEGEVAIAGSKGKASDLAKTGVSWIDLKYSALTSNSAIPVRIERIQRSFADIIPATVLDSCDFKNQWEYGNLMMHCFIPDDFQKLVEDCKRLTLVVDRETARIPWEMAGVNSKKSRRFFGTDRHISRQFRSVLGNANAHPPELNHELKLLLIADPTSDSVYALQGAVKEAFEIAEIFADAQKVYGNKIKITVHLRVGNKERNVEDRDKYCGKMRSEFGVLKQKFIDSAKSEGVLRPIEEIFDADFCRPIEILKLLVHNRYDIVHFAGHGRFVPETGEMGWMLNNDCTLTAREIFKVRQVPRLVFANACRSGVVENDSEKSDESDEPSNGLTVAGAKTAEPSKSNKTLESLYEEVQTNLSGHWNKVLFGHMSMAEAFFSRGIPNFIGSGWNVHDGLALQIATEFYRQLLGIENASNGSDRNFVQTDGKCIGEALLEARKIIGPDEKHSTNKRANETPADLDDYFASNGHNTWGAYQHYGLPTDKVFEIGKVQQQG